MFLSASSPKQLSFCGSAVKQYDYDRYLISLFYPEPQREALFALYAFNAELARIKLTVSTPLLGHIRLQWWYEEIERLSDPIPKPNDILTSLAKASHSFALNQNQLLALIEAREAEFSDQNTATDAEIGPIFELSLSITDPNCSASLEPIIQLWSVITAFKNAPSKLNDPVKSLHDRASILLQEIKASEPLRLIKLHLDVAQITLNQLKKCHFDPLNPKFLHPYPLKPAKLLLKNLPF